MWGPLRLPVSDLRMAGWQPSAPSKVGGPVLFPKGFISFPPNNCLWAGVGKPTGPNRTWLCSEERWGPPWRPAGAGKGDTWKGSSWAFWTGWVPAPWGWHCSLWLLLQQVSPWLPVCVKTQEPWGGAVGSTEFLQISVKVKWGQCGGPGSNRTGVPTRRDGGLPCRPPSG